MERASRALEGSERQTLRLCRALLAAGSPPPPSSSWMESRRLQPSRGSPGGAGEGLQQQQPQHAADAKMAPSVPAVSVWLSDSTN